ncbi:MAG: restriction endonuclease [Bacteroidetes bacterium]|nr:restriction endonuclease [Bacteroidota bacterium]
MYIYKRREFFHKLTLAAIMRDTSLFVWKDNPLAPASYIEYYTSDNTCPVCKIQLIEKISGPPGKTLFNPQFSPCDSYYNCPLCGWYFRSTINWDWGGSWDKGNDFISRLFEFEINDDSVELKDLGNYLLRNNKSLYDLSWRKFEELTADIFRQNKWEIILTQKSRDGGADVILLQNGKKFGIIECKKYSNTRKVGIKTIRELIGASIDFEVKNAFLFTTSGFTSIANDKKSDYFNKGFNLNLVDATDFFEYLNIYNKKYPSIYKLSQNQVEEIIKSNIERSK